KPGWARVGFHYTLDDTEADYLIEAVRFVAERGARFLPLYTFDVHSGTWAHRDDARQTPSLDLTEALAAHSPRPPMSPDERTRRYETALRDARALAAELGEARCEGALSEDLADLQFFAMA
ncbi:MAG: aminotransferase, partial [Bacteroidota bacterium]